MTAILVSGLSKNYGKQAAVKDIHLTVNEGEIFGFIGPNGAGKSTTIKMLMNFIYPSAGSAQIFGMDCMKDSVEIKKITGFISSEVAFFPKMSAMAIFEYVADFHQLTDYHKEIEKYVALFEMDPHKSIESLSLGNKQKVAIVATLLSNPKLLILDEPTNGLDPKMQHRFFELLKEKQQEGLTVFLSSHDLNEVQNYCQRVAFIKEGQIIAEENIAENPTHIKKIILSGKNILGDKLKMIGAEIIQQNETQLIFMYEGNWAHLFELLASMTFDDIEIRPVTLDEHFMAMYK